MKDKQIFQLHADICQALTHLIRLEIINDLRNGEKSVAQLAAALQAPQGTVSPHLNIMRRRVAP